MQIRIYTSAVRGPTKGDWHREEEDLSSTFENKDARKASVALRCKSTPTKDNSGGPWPTEDLL